MRAIVIGFMLAAAGAVIGIPSGFSSDGGGAVFWSPDRGSMADGSIMTVRPGAQLDPGCTVGLLFEGDGTQYASTAGHCVELIGKTPRLRGASEPFGEVVAWRYAGEAVEDWALIRIYDNVSATPSVRHWAGPTPPTALTDVDRDDVVCHYGWGQGYERTEATRHRCGRMAYTQRYRNVTGYKFRGRSETGDSGSPVIHYATGQPIGLLTRGKPPYDAGGIDVCSLLDRFAAHGYDLTVATAPYDPPPKDPTVPAPTVHPMRVTHAEPTDCFGSGLGGGLAG